jgi:hypothetical protein
MRENVWRFAVSMVTVIVPAGENEVGADIMTGCGSKFPVALSNK